MRVSSAEYAQLLARQKRIEQTGSVATSEAVTRESDLHEQIFAECRRRGWIAFHGAMSERTARTCGEPDFIILGSRVDSALGLNGETRMFPAIWLIECKTRTGKLSPAQQAISAWAAKLGHTVHVVRSFNEFLDVVTL